MAPTVSRDTILFSLGLDPSKRGATDMAKDARIVAALKAAQRTEYFLKPVEHVNPDNLPQWTAQSSTLSLSRCFGGASMAETGGNPFVTTTLPDNPFNDLRQSLMALGLACEKTPAWGHIAIVQSKDMRHGFCMRILEIKELYDNAVSAGLSQGHARPMLVLAYMATDPFGADQRVPNHPIPRWLLKVTSGKFRGVEMRTIWADADEQYLLLKQLEMNAALLSPEYKDTRWPEEKAFKLSFLLPCYPLNSLSLSKLQVPVYCASKVCGLDAHSLCGGCGLLRYCSKACQKSDWPTHKVACKVADQGPHYTFTVEPEIRPNTNRNVVEVRFTTNIHDSPPDIFRKNLVEEKKENAPLVPDKHGKQLFMVKLQTTVFSTFPGDVRLGITDPSRSIACSVPLTQTGAKHLLTIMRKGRDGTRLYIHAQRVDDSTIKLFYENLPDQNTRW